MATALGELIGKNHLCKKVFKHKHLRKTQIIYKLHMLYEHELKVYNKTHNCSFLRREGMETEHYDKVKLGR